MRGRMAGAAHWGWMIVAALLLAPLPSAHAATVVTTYESAGTTLPNFSGSVCNQPGVSQCVYGTENFQNWTGANNYQSGFNDGANDFTSSTYITGVYSAGPNTTVGTDWLKSNANQYGGVGGNGYPELFGPTASQANDPTATENSYSVAFTAHGVPGVNYFGIWISALDAHNDLRGCLETSPI
ncbi:MAG: hypothetical protein KGL52_07105 [Rhodospirillales bacterium]|nr:hypothetical protein [Rhodospirillales bacterium]